MRRTRTYFFLGTLILLIGIFLVLQKPFIGKQRLAIATKQVEAITNDNIIQDGDIIFQTSLSRQSKAIALATHSEYTHCGIIFSFDTGSSKYYVIEAEARVRWTPLNKWIARGRDGKFVIKRIKMERAFSPDTLRRLRSICGEYLGKEYDPYFNWDDDKIYCSELVWKAYHKLNGYQLGTLQLLKDFDLSNEAVKAKLRERYGDKIPINDTVISPVSIFRSNLLKTVYEN